MTRKKFFKKWKKRAWLWLRITFPVLEKIYYGIQRGIYGYSEEDTYQVDTWLADIMPKMLDELIEKRQDGCPARLLSGTKVTEEEIIEGIEKWRSILREIKHGFEVWHNLYESNSYNKEDWDKARIEIKKSLEVMAEYC
jgi:hypothetical protein